MQPVQSIGRGSARFMCDYRAALAREMISVVHDLVEMFVTCSVLGDLELRTVPGT
jgi:hypothetical protein